MHSDGLPLEVVFFGGPVCSCVSVKDFLEWPQSQGWQLNTSQSLEQLAARAQAWLYFGLLHICTGTSLQLNEVIRVTSSTRWAIDTRTVTSMVQSMTENLVQPHSSPAGQQGTPIENALIDTTTAIDNIVEQHIKLAAGATDLDIWNSEISASFLALDILRQQLYDRITLDSTSHRSPKLIVAHTNVLSHSLLKVGRCPSLSTRLQLSPTDWYQLLHSDQSDSVTRVHAQCSGQVCQLFNTDPKTYRPSHCASCLGCNHMRIDSSLLTACMKDDGIPLIKLRQDRNGRLRTQLVRGSLTSRYVAISHVWAGGMGNFSSNSLPECQLQYLYHTVAAINNQNRLPVDLLPHKMTIRFLRRLNVMTDNLITLARSYLANNDEPELFWLDTLCIPVHEKYKEHRKAAIASMASIYAGAQKVLVLDPELTSKACNDLHGDWHLHLAASPWMSRSWPLQEAALAANLFVAFSDGVLQYIVQTSTKPNRGWKRVNLPVTQALRGDRVGVDKTFLTIWNELSRRTTTQPKDVPLIFAALLGRSAAEVAALPYHQQMTALIGSQKRVHSTILFEGFTHCTPGDVLETWVPSVPSVRNTSEVVDGEFSSLKVVDGGFVFGVPKDDRASPIFAISCLSPPLDAVKIMLNRPHGKSSILIQFDTGKASVKSVPPSRKLLLLFSRNRYSPSSPLRGVCFNIREESESRSILTFRTNFSWSTVNEVQSRDILVVESDDDRTSASSGRSKYFFSIGTPLWPKLQWHKADVYPFSQLFYPYMYLIVSPMISIYAYAYLILIYLTMGRLQEVTIVVILGPVRTVMSLFELSFEREWAHQFAQQRWAASFLDSPKAQKMLETFAPPFMHPVRVMHSALIGVCMLWYIMDTRKGIPRTGTVRFTRDTIWQELIWRTYLCWSSTQLEFGYLTYTKGRASQRHDNRLRVWKWIERIVLYAFWICYLVMGWRWERWPEVVFAVLIAVWPWRPVWQQSVVPYCRRVYERLWVAKKQGNPGVYEPVPVNEDEDEEAVELR